MPEATYLVSGVARFVYRGVTYEEGTTLVLPSSLAGELGFPLASPATSDPLPLPEAPVPAVSSPSEDPGPHGYPDSAPSLPDAPGAEEASPEAPQSTRRPRKGRPRKSSVLPVDLPQVAPPDSPSLDEPL